MAAPTNADPLVEAVLRYVEPVLTAGLPAEHQAWARQAYAGTIIPSRLRTSSKLPDRDRQGLAELVAADIAAEMDRWPPAERWLAIVSAYYDSLLAPLSRRTYELAERAADRSRPDPAEARRLQGDLASLAGELEGQPEAVRRALAAELSEAQLDCAYAIAGGGPMSLRLGAG